jgi:hypothetical protein
VFWVKLKLLDIGSLRSYDTFLHCHFSLAPLSSTIACLSYASSVCAAISFLYTLWLCSLVSLP